MGKKASSPGRKTLRRLLLGLLLGPGRPWTLGGVRTKDYEAYQAPKEPATVATLDAADLIES